MEHLKDNNFMGISHIGIFTDDIEKTKRFYIENFGFSIDFETVIDKPDNQRVKIMMLKLGNLVLEMIEYSDKGKTKRGNAGCIDHLSIRVEDLCKAIDDLKVKGNIFETKEPRTINYIYNGVKVIYLTGPNGERIELIECFEVSSIPS
jgi:catechol 2,3-dioxygenase-like lactoylglutathione lyase family enzyme